MTARKNNVNMIPVILKHGLTLELSPATIERNTKIAVIIEMTNVASCNPSRYESFQIFDAEAEEIMQADNSANEFRVKKVKRHLLVRRYSF